MLLYLVILLLIIIAREIKYRKACNDAMVFYLHLIKALPSAYSNSVLSKTLENIGRSTGSYSAATANANASTALTATGTLKPMGASKKEKLHSQNTSRTFISFLSAVGSDDSFFEEFL